MYICVNYKNINLYNYEFSLYYFVRYSMHFAMEREPFFVNNAVTYRICVGYYLHEYKR
jgi:hypothetical protein